MRIKHLTIAWFNCASMVAVFLLFMANMTEAAGATCPCSIWPSTAQPAVAADPDTSAVELGVKFQSDKDGFITGIRFYKGKTNTGTHVGTLWSSTGQMLAKAAFTNETATGWQQVNFAPVAITANTTYVASYLAPKAHYSVTEPYFNGGVDNPPLHALANSVSPNGVYKYGGGFPTATWNSSNYWVDVVFTTTATADTTPPTVTAFTIPATATTLTVPITSFTATDNVGVTGYLVTESSSAPQATASGWSATAPTSYAFTTAGSKTLYAWAKDAAGNVSASKSATVTITLSDTTKPTVTAFTIPATATTLTVPITTLHGDGQRRGDRLPGHRIVHASLGNGQRVVGNRPDFLHLHDGGQQDAVCLGQGCRRQCVGKQERYRDHYAPDNGPGAGRLVCGRYACASELRRLSGSGIEHVTARWPPTIWPSYPCWPIWAMARCKTPPQTCRS